MNNTDRLKRVTLAAMLLALCVVGANLKIMGSIAFDSMPAFLGAILLGPWFGLFLGIAGHLTSAALSGFPLTVPIHLVIALCMGICMFVFGKIRHQVNHPNFLRVLVSDGMAYVLNVPLALLLLSPLMGKAVMAFFFPLTIAVAANIVLCEIVYVALPDRVLSAQFLR